MECDLSDFKLDPVDDSQTISQLLKKTKLYKFRFYLKTKKSRKSGINDMGQDTELQGNCFIDDLPDLTVPHQETVISKTLLTVGVQEITSNSLDTEPVTDLATVKDTIVLQRAEILPENTIVKPATIPDDNENSHHVNQDNPFKTISDEAWMDSLGEIVIPGFKELRSTPKDMEITVHRGHVFRDLRSYFKTCVDINPKIDNIMITVILPNGDVERADDFGGVMRDVLTEFWEQFYESCTVGYNLKIPSLRHDFQHDDWAAIARIIVIGWTLQKMLPIRLAPSFLNCCLYGMDFKKTNEDSLLDEYLQFISPIEQELLIQALKDFNSVDYDDLLDFLGNHDCKVLVTSSNLRETILQMASKEMFQEPSFIKETMFNVLVTYNLDVNVKNMNSCKSQLRESCQSLNLIMQASKHVIFFLNMSESSHQIS